MVEPDAAGLPIGRPQSGAEFESGEVAAAGHAVIEAPDALERTKPAAPQYLLSLALQRGPYPYEHRTVVAAALDAVTESESHPDDWNKAIRRAHKEGGEVRVVRVALDADLVASVFERGAGPLQVLDPGPPGAGYAVRLALATSSHRWWWPRSTRRWLRGWGSTWGARCGGMPVFYRRQAAKAFGELRRSWSPCRARRWTPPSSRRRYLPTATYVLTSQDPRF